MKTKEEYTIYMREYWPSAVALRDIGKYLIENKMTISSDEHWNVTRQYLHTDESVKLNHDLGLFTINR